MNDLSQRFTNKKILVTGAASGIGKAAALGFAKEGGLLGTLDKDADGLIALDNEITGLGLTPPEIIVCDLAEPETIKAAVEGFAETPEPGLDLVVNMAAFAGFTDDFTLELEDWNKILAVNLTGTWLVIQASLPYLIKSKGTIVNAASTAGTDAAPYQSAYSASKGGVVALTKALSINHQSAGIRINAIAPGPIDTPIAKQYSLKEYMDQQLLATMMPFGQMGSPEEVASAVLFLASDDASHINGHILKIDGGKQA